MNNFDSYHIYANSKRENANISIIYSMVGTLDLGHQQLDMKLKAAEDTVLAAFWLSL